MDTIQISGMAELQRELLNFAPRIAKNVLARAVYAGGKIVRDDARNRVNKLSGKTSKRIRIARAKTARGAFAVIYRVGVFGKGANEGFWLEYGTKAHKIPKVTGKSKILAINGHYAKQVQHPGARSFPFLRPAFDNNQTRILEAMRAKLREGIEREYVRQAIHGRS
jgi:hypothetical protein